MLKYEISLTEDAKVDLSWYHAFEQKLILSQIKEQLLHDPLTETRNRKRLRENPVAPWELRTAKHRVFYHVPEDTSTVSVVAVGHKEHNVLYIRGKEVKL